MFGVDNETRAAFEEMHRRLDYLEAAFHEYMIEGKLNRVAENTHREALK